MVHHYIGPGILLRFSAHLCHRATTVGLAKDQTFDLFPHNDDDKNDDNDDDKTMMTMMIMMVIAMPLGIRTGCKAFQPPLVEPFMPSGVGITKKVT